MIESHSKNLSILMYVWNIVRKPATPNGHELGSEVLVVSLDGFTVTLKDRKYTGEKLVLPEI